MPPWREVHDAQLHMSLNSINGFISYRRLERFRGDHTHITWKLLCSPVLCDAFSQHPAELVFVGHNGVTLHLFVLARLLASVSLIE